MERKNISFNERKAAIFFMIFGAVCMLPLFAYVIINDISTGSEHLMHNLGAMIIIYLSTVAITEPIGFIIYRHRIDFDYSAQKIIYVPYLGKERIYSFDEIVIKHEKSKHQINVYNYVFYKDGKQIFKIEGYAFTKKGKDKFQYIHELFTGTEKSNFDWEKKYSAIKGVSAQVFEYSEEHPNRLLRIDRAEKSYYIVINNDEEKRVYHITINERMIISKTAFSFVVIEKIACEYNQIDCACDHLIDKYSKI